MTRSSYKNPSICSKYFPFKNRNTFPISISSPEREIPPVAPFHPYWETDQSGELRKPEKYFSHWDDKKHYWSRRGIPGPEAEILYGNLRALRNYYSPRSLVVREWTKPYGKVCLLKRFIRSIFVLPEGRQTDTIEC